MAELVLGKFGKQFVFVFLTHRKMRAVQHLDTVIVEPEHFVHVDDHAPVADKKTVLFQQLLLHLCKIVRGPAFAVIGDDLYHMIPRQSVMDPGKRQLLLEQAVTSLEGITEGILGADGKRYAAYLTSVLMYLGIANLIGILGFKPPTKDLNVTAALAIMSIVLIEYAGIHQKGVKRWLKGFAEPIALVAPINVLELFIKPLSLCMRLFGNVLGAFVIMELIEYIMPVGLPVVFSMYFDIFDGLIQAYVFVFLTGLFIKEAME